MRIVGNWNRHLGTTSLIGSSSESGHDAPSGNVRFGIVYDFAEFGEFRSHLIGDRAPLRSCNMLAVLGNHNDWNYQTVLLPLWIAVYHILQCTSKLKRSLRD